MPFGRCNGPASYQHYINYVLFSFIAKFCTTYPDDSLVNGEMLTENQLHICWVLEKLWEAELQVYITKSQFHVQDVMFLNMVVLTKGLKIDQSTVAAVKDWEPPKMLHVVQSFLGFANF